ncbi:MAG: hypothetical protein HYZ25_10955 [Chloroflexi bacterium]|nr:hypothetical protein [Chloroflexota bacterium]
MRTLILALTLLLLLTTACAPAPTPTVAPVTEIVAPTETFTPIPNPTLTEIPTAMATATEAPTFTPSPIPTVESLKASVSADLLSCRYGPGAEYLFLYGLRKGANIQLIGRTNGNDWLYVAGKNPCWVKAEFLSIEGDDQALPVVYPGIAKLPKSPYYPPTTVLSAVRTGNSVTVEWSDVPLRAGDEEDESMLHYIVEVWHCEGGQYLFSPLATNDLTITFVDEPGCSQPSFGRIFVQEKHGFAGPTEIPWP